MTNKLDGNPIQIVLVDDDDVVRIGAVSFREEIERELDEIADMLVAKNKAYGSSFDDPLRIFSRSDTREQLHVRIDDKLSRIARGRDLDAVPEDTVKDLMGYLVLLRVLDRRESEAGI